MFAIFAMPKLLIRLNDTPPQFIKTKNIMKEIRKLDEKQSSKPIRMLVNLGDYNVNNESTKENEFYGARKLNKKQIIPGRLNKVTGQYTFPNATNQNKAVITMRISCDSSCLQKSQVLNMFPVKLFQILKKKHF